MLQRSNVLALILLVLIPATWVITEDLHFVATVYGIDLAYIMQCSADELKQYFPNFYWLVYVGSFGLKFVLPAAFIALLWFVAKFRKRVVSIVKKYWSTDLTFAQSIVWPFAISMGIGLIVYYVLRDSSSDPYRFQLLLTRSVLLVNVLNWALSAYAGRELLRKSIQSFLFVPALPYSLAITRILFFGYLAFLYSAYFIPSMGPTIGMLSKAPLPFIGWLIEITPVNPELYKAIGWVGVFASLMVAIGFRTRFFLVVNALVVFYIIATPNFFGKLHHQQVVIWIAWILAFSPCYDVLSVDSLLKKGQQAVSKPIYSFHLRIIWLHIGLIYFFAGFYKLWICGFDWALTNSMINQVQIEWFEHFDKVSDWRVDKLPWLLKVGGFGVIIFELGYILMLAFKRLRWVSVFGGLAMHNFLGKVMYISFLGMLQVFYVVFIPWNYLLKKIGIIGKNLTVDPELPKLKTIAIAGPLFILGMNMVFGTFNINSYPFSIYPVYAEIVPNNVKYFEYRVLDKDLEHLDFRDEGRAHHFRWESYSRMEYHMIRMWEAGNELDSAGVRTMWKRWQLAVPTLEEVNAVDVYIVERPLDPEKKEVRLSEKYLMTVSK